MNLKKFNTEQKALREVKKRVRKILSTVLSSKCNVSGYIANGIHEISFDIQTADGFLSGRVGIKAS